MPPRVFLHIGAPLTGSTYLRAGLARNRRRLTRFGVLYPTSHVGDDDGHLDAVLDVLALSANHGARTTGAWERLAQGVRDWRRGTVVVSHELMADADEAQAARIVGSLGNAEVHLVYTTRDLGRQIPRAWQEWVLNGGTATFETYVSLLARNDPHRLSRVFWRSHDVEVVLRRWSARVPAERVHLVTAPAGPDEDAVLWERFTRTVGLDPRRLHPPRSRSRALLPLASAEVLRLLNVEAGQRSDPGRLREVADALAATSGPLPALPDGLRPWLRDETDRMVSAVKNRGYDVRGDVTDLLAEPDVFATADEQVRPRAEDVVRAQTALLATVTGLSGRAGGPAGLRRRALRRWARP